MQLCQEWGQKLTDWFKAGGHKFCVAENAEEELEEWGLDFMEEEGGDDDHEDGKAADVQNLQRVRTGQM